MSESLQNIEDEPFPSFLSASLSSSHATLGNVTLGSTLGVPVAASTVAKIRAGLDNRVSDVQASYLEDGQLSLANSLSSNGERKMFALSFNDELDKDSFIQPHCLSDLLVKVRLDETDISRLKPSTLGPPKQLNAPAGRPSEPGDELSTGLITFSHQGAKDVLGVKATVMFPGTLEEESPPSEGADSDRYSGSVYSFLANEKLLSAYSMHSDVTDDDLNADHLHDDELEMYFKKLVPPAMQRGRVEGQELPSADLTGNQDSSSNPSSTEPEKDRYPFLDEFDQDDFHMPDVRLAATGMDSCPASDEDTEDELEAARRHSSARPRFLLPSTSRQLVGESHRPNFRPGLEGGSSDDEEPAGSRNAPASSGIEFRRSAEGQVINSPVTGDGGGGGDGSSGSEEDGNDGGVSTVPLPPGSSQTPYDALRGLGMVGEDGARDEASVPGHSEMGDRVGPVGTGEAGSMATTSGSSRGSPAHWSMALDRQEALDAMDSTESAAADGQLDSLYLRSGAGLWRPPDVSASALFQGTQSSFHLSQVLSAHSSEEAESLGLRGGPCGDSAVPEPSDSNSEGEPRAASLEAKYLSRTLQGDDSDDCWSHCPDSAELDFQQEPNVTHNVVYQNEEGKWVTDLAYYSSFEKETEKSLPEDVAVQFQSEDFVSGSNAIEKIIEDQEEFEKENQFIQEEQMVAQSGSSSSLGLGDTSWRLPTSGHVLMRVSQVSSEFERGNQSYLRLSLGEFFQQRSEALGCLGDSEEDRVRRPSFGYVITSPEKREPFALIRPSDFSSRGSSVHSDTLHHSDVDNTMNPEDLDKTFEAVAETSAQKADEHSVAVEKEEAQEAGAQVPGNKSAQSGSPDSLGGSSDPTLSISTIASAIADASVSSDPAQLAAMIMELSKKNRSRSRWPGGAAPASNSPHPPPAERSGLLEALQRSVSAGELSAFDIEKYLRRAETSGSDSDASASPHSFDILAWADSLGASCRKSSPAVPAQNAKAPPAGKDEARAEQKEGKASAVGPCSSAPPSTGPGKKSDVRRSSIPRPKASCGPAGLAGAGRRSVGSGQSSVLEAKAGLSKNPPRGTATPAANRSSAGTGAKLGTVRPHAHSTEAALRPAPEPSSILRASPRQQGGRTEPAPIRSPAGLRQGSEGHEGERTGVRGRGPAAPAGAAEKHVGFAQSPVPPAQGKAASSPVRAPAGMEETQCNFRPSTSPLTHSSPSQASLPSADGTVPSLSRLTYISLNDSTALPTPDRNKLQCDSSIALSTTIVRASPTPMGELEVPPSHHGDTLHTAEGLDPRSRTKSPDSRYASDHSSPRSRSECDFRSDSQDPLCNGGSRKHQSASSPRRFPPGDSGYSSNLNIQQPGAAGQPAQPWPGTADKAELRSGAAFGLPRSFTPEDLRYVPIASFKPQGALLDLPAGVPSLLAGRSLLGSQLAQQYLGREVPLHPYHISAAAAVYGVPPASAPGPALPHGYVNAADLHGTHLTPLDTRLMGAAKPYGQHHLGAPGVWVPGGVADLRVQVVVPEELRFPNACCVGIASQTSLSIFNPTERWLQVALAVTSLSIDGEKVDSLPYQLLIIKNKTIIGPKSTEEQKVLFIPPRAGLYQCVLSVSSWPTAAESEAVARAEVFAKRVILIAVAENPSLEVDVGASGCLDFGDLASGSAKALPLKLVNKTRATVPVRLVISANASAWRCFTFSKSPVAVPTEGMVPTGSVTPLAAPSVMNHVMHANYGDNPESFMVWVHFHAPQKYASTSGELGPAEEYSARVDIEVDSPGPSHVIRSVPLRARSGTARVHAPKDLQTVCLSAPLGKSARQTLPLKNAGNIDVQLKLKCSDSEDCFSVKPEELLLRAGEEQGIVVCFTASGTRKYRESMLTILVLPYGPQYEVVLKGEVAPDDSAVAAATRAPPGKAGHEDGVIPGDVPPILSNKQFMAWGGVTLGRAMQQKLVLRNNSPSTTQQLRLLIRGQDQDCFQLQSTFGPEERLTRHRELSIRPREDVAVHLLYAPTRVACMLAKLEIKQSGVRPSQPGVKFTIPLSGYGGTSNIVLEDVRKVSDSYVVTVGGVAAGRVSKVCLSMRNTGSRAAFVKAAAYAELPTRTLMDPSVISMSPSQFVLKERTQEVVTVLLKATQREQSLCQASSGLLATVCFFCGDEVSRQQFRRLLRTKPDAGHKVLSDNSLLKNINFNERFLGEEQVTEVFDLPQRPNEAQLFYSHVNKVVLSVLGSTEASDSGDSDCMESLRPSPRRGSESDSGFGNSDRHVSNVSLDVLPVKGPQGPPLALPVGDPTLKGPSNPGAPQDSWSVQPEQLVLTAPTISGSANTRHVHIQNHSSRELSFELSWPAHCLTITPQHGVIEPQSHLQILISPNPSLASRSSLLPWSGQIYVQCDGQQKFIKVQIRQDLALDVSATAPSVKPLSALPPQAQTPPTSVGATPPGNAHVEIRNRTLVFPATPSGETSESVLEVENKGEEVRWYLSSFAPPYVKGVDSSGDVYRATYTAFRCSRVSGTLGQKEKMQVPITFLPRDRGDYAQFWDLECHPVAEPQQKSRVRFQLCGTGVKAGAQTIPGESDCSLVRTEAIVKARKRPDAAVVKSSQEEVPRRGVYAPQDLYSFPPTRVGEASTLKVNVRNNSFDTHELKFISPREPFYIKHSKYSLRSQHYINLPVQFKPAAAGKYSGSLLIQTDTSSSLAIQLSGEALA
ncbi:hypothetical protein MATL_G00135730 [Megalops atlanticus]|uniref:Centrosomal protein of 192 kDa n=1 Tax=Megalops atlanticus TaxID=7932 RepID=A0A9D3PYT0_MEGAT|nr:hypothetical protein MATL_G00135730 [Megalops atlanticus]